MTLENQPTVSSKETTSQDFQDPQEDVCTCDDCESQRNPSGSIGQRRFAIVTTVQTTSRYPRDSRRTSRNPGHRAANAAGANQANPQPNKRKPEKQHRRRTRMVNMYCLKCKSKREVGGAQAVTMKNGKPAIHGVCPECSAKVFA